MILAMVAPYSSCPLKPPGSLPSSTSRFLLLPQANLSSTPHIPCSLVASSASTGGPIARKRKRYRKPYPGESEGITEEMRFVAMRLRNAPASGGSGAGDLEKDGVRTGVDLWQPSMEGFVKYLVDSKLVFETIERIVDESSDVAYVYFRKSGLERLASLSKDLEWFTQQDIVIPEPSSPGVSYAKYLNQLAESNAPSFLCHFYNIYFAHITGGVRIGMKVSEKLLEGRQLEFYKWDGDVQLLLRDVRQKLNKHGAHWPREEKNKCLREAAKSFRYSGQIIRLIIL